MDRSFFKVIINKQLPPAAWRKNTFEIWWRVFAFPYCCEYYWRYIHCYATIIRKIPWVEKKNRKKILEVVELCEKKNTYRKQTSLFARGIIIWGSIWIDLLKEKYSLPLSLWYQSQRNYGSKQSIDCELRVNQYCVKKTRKKKKKGIICLLWCEGLRVAVWIQGNGLIIPFELIAKTGNFFFFNVDYVFFISFL